MAPKLLPIPPPPLQTLFAAKDNVSQSGIGFNWEQWLQALYASVQAQLANISALAIEPVTQSALPNNLNTKEAGALFSVTDFGHVLQWNGASYQWGPGELGSGYVQAFLMAPTTQGWHICDGSTVPMLNSNGTVTSVSLPNYTTSTYLKLGLAAAAGPNAASGQSQAVSAGSVSGSVGSIIISGSTGFESSDVTVQSGAGATVAAPSHTHSAGSLTASTPPFSGGSLGVHSHGPGTLDLLNAVLLGYFRQ